jgi:hypothetical protein
MALKVALTGIVGVFIGLAILCISLILIQKIVSYFTDKKFKSKQDKDSENLINLPKKHGEVSGEVIAALAASIYLDLRSFDEKKKLLTIQKVTKPYSPWVNSGKAMMISENNNLLNSRTQSGL